MDKRKESRTEVILKHVMEMSAWITSAFIILMMVLITYDVFLRYLFRSPSGWIDDFISLYLMIYVTLLPAAWIMLRGEHVSVDIVISHLRPKQRYFMNLVILILGLLYSIVLTWQGWLFAWRELRNSTTFPTTAWLPVGPSVSVIFIGGILLCLACAMKIVSHILSPIESEHEKAVETVPLA